MLRLCAYRLALFLFLIGLAGVARAQAPSESSSVIVADLVRRLAELERKVADQDQEIKTLREKVARPAGTQPDSPTVANSPVEDGLVATAKARSANESAAHFFSETVLGGARVKALMDVYYAYNTQQPVSGLSQLRGFDNETNQFSLNLIELGIVRSPAPEKRLGYDFALGFGNAMNVVNGTDPGGGNFAQYLKEAYISYLASAGNGIQIDVGKFPTPATAEVMESSSNWNYSRSFSYNYATPYYLFGMRATYRFKDAYSLTGLLVNGWNNIVDSYSSGKTIGLSLDWAASPKFSVSETWLGGRGAIPIDTGQRNVLYTVVRFMPIDKLSLMAGVDYGRSGGINGAQHLMHWAALAGYARYQLNPRYAFAARYEYYNDRDGITTCGACTVLTPQHLGEVTATLERRIQQHLLTRLEFRRDWSDEPIFFRADTPIRNQSTVTLGVTYAAESGK
jgi:hypothetical protein